MEDVYRYIDQHAQQYIERLRSLCRQPSVAAQNIGLQETAEMVLALLQEIGAEARIFPTAGAPVVFGSIRGRSNRTLTLYDHYDVQPAEPLELWHSDPFAAEVRDGRIWARGAADNKGNLVARICAVEAYRKVRGDLPLQVKFFFDGEEEIGGTSAATFAASHRDLIAADGCIWEAGYKDARGRPEIYLGVKGDCYVELEVTCADADLHSSWGGVVPNAIWRLVWAMNRIKGPDERILIPGFYDPVRGPTPEELQTLERMRFDEQGALKKMGLTRFLRELSGLSLLVEHLFQPTATLCGFSGGYQGPGVKTVLPHQARLKLDFRLVPDQAPDQVCQQLRQHLAREGFSDIEVRFLSGSHPARTALDDPLVDTVVETARRVYGIEPIVYPLTAGSGPMYDLCQRFGIPAVSTGVGNAESHTHAPNENIRIEDYIQGIKHIAAILEEFAAVGNAG